ncbi:hypothetical protein AZE42_08049 [Rhizopogon vesiculosus]|uniref:C2H2-type domain-containing protein n=1 Tax=Rhizopogon vesiculosus TaxID=180088 RepID=A0A1J8QSQ7_9AGAM|nr:hypothetical protein AZE42_08049 [Rhizopogon vesiculosus]
MSGKTSEQSKIDANQIIEAEMWRIRNFHVQQFDVHSESSMTRPVASQAMLEANQRRRRHEANHRCDECGQAFTAIFSLRRHVQTHTGVRPFVCSIPGCRQAFFDQSDCRRHEKSTKRHMGLPNTVSVSP